MKKIAYNMVDSKYLDDIQGNILYPHKREHARHLFLSFENNKDISPFIYSWIQNFAHNYITSCLQDIVSSRKSLFCTFLLSAAGYRALGMNMPKDLAFQLGMKKRGHLLHDPEPDSWESNYSERSIDAMIIIADDNPITVAQKAVLIKEGLQVAGGFVLAEEQGVRLIRSNLEIEHFGFVDNISQPKEQKIKIKGTDKETLITNPESLMVPDPYSGYGSYLVYRKLEQNVKLWEDNIQALAKITNSSPFLVGAWAMGRFKDGTPVTTNSEMQKQNKPDNSFDYSQDANGNCCPFHGHMRKMNTRIGTRDPRIARRAMSYGLRPDLHPQGRMFALPKKGVGLLFMCFQNDLEQGFEHLQQIANNTDLPIGNSGQDPLIGQGTKDKSINKWPTHYNSSERITYAFDRTVILKGGEYFFAPSISFLKHGIVSPK